MTLPRIAIASLGGTISMTPDAAAGGVVPRLSAEQLAASVPGLSEVANISAESLFQLPSASLSFPNLLAALAWAERQVDAGAAGVVLTQGTDSIEESAFFLDLYWQREAPLIVTGAMRAPQSAGAEGPANLLSAVLAARSKDSRGRGVMVVMNDTIHAARWVRKRHTLTVQAFESPETGPLGVIVEGIAHYFHPAGTRPPALPPVSGDVRVALLETYMGDDGQIAELVRAAGYQGLVIGGFGAGHLSFGFAERMEALCADMPVIIATRTGAGPTTSATYGYIGSEVDLARRGAIMAGWLCPRKARALLWGMLAGGIGRCDIARAWKDWHQNLR
ncbi:asparaginase [Achromobacter sp. GG226]|uniref:asparaginase n=1 Tax=Verticiella alkaliphila TaxID=2779529 RepID=UPI001C0CEC7B|nr:asparaginase [Verticiella sp. GG226]MBU4612123.1 asparaginase [Verticiella sp. GG226]